MIQNAMQNRRSEERVVQIFLEATVRVNFKLIIQERGQQYENTGPIGRSVTAGSSATRFLQGKTESRIKSHESGHMKQEKHEDKKKKKKKSQKTKAENKL